MLGAIVATGLWNARRASGETALSHDVIVVGLGTMGSAAAWQLAARGCSVLGLDRRVPPHDFGSAHGRSRIIRTAYMEDPAYVPLVQRSFDLWRHLQRLTRTELLRPASLLMIGPPDGAAVSGSLASARAHALPHDLLDACEIRRRFPAFEPDDDLAAFYEEVAGVLAPESCVAACLAAASAAGADLRYGEQVLGWDQAGRGLRVRTDTGDHTADALVVAAGAWASQLLPAVDFQLRVERQVMHWFEPSEGLDAFAPDRFPVYLWEPRAGPVLYGMPALDGPSAGVKAAIHHDGETTTAERLDRTVHEADIAAVRSCLAERIPSINGRWLEGAVCMYTNTPDLHFVIGPHPAADGVFVAAGFSGHGFKFAPVVGEVLADLVVDGNTSLPVEPFAPARFG